MYEFGLRTTGPGAAPASSTPAGEKPSIPGTDTGAGAGGDELAHAGFTMGMAGGIALLLMLGGAAKGWSAYASGSFRV